MARAAHQEFLALEAQVKAGAADPAKAATILINGINAKIAAAGSEPDKLNQLQAQLKESTEALVAAFKAGGSASPAAPAAPTPKPTSADPPYDRGGRR